MLDFGKMLEQQITTADMQFYQNDTRSHQMEPTEKRRPAKTEK